MRDPYGQAYADMKDKKIIFFGPVGAGKTTAIDAVTHSDNATTDARVSDSSVRRKKSTTVAMDYALLDTGNERIHLYGTPGQERFRFMWEMITTELAHDCSGHIMLLDNARNHPRQDLEFYLQNFRTYNPKVRLVIGITGSDLIQTPSRSDYAGWLAELEINAPLFFVDARRAEDIHMLIDEVLQSEKPVTQASPSSSAWESEEEMSIDELFSTATQFPVFTPGLVNDIEKIDQVTGTALINNDNLAEYSSLEKTELDILQQFSSEIPRVRRRVDDFGAVESFHLSTQSGDHFTVLVADNQLLGIHCKGQLSMLSLKQEIDNLMQWSKSTSPISA